MEEREPPRLELEPEPEPLGPEQPPALMEPPPMHSEQAPETAELGGAAEGAEASGLDAGAAAGAGAGAELLHPPRSSVAETTKAAAKGKDPWRMISLHL